MSMKLFKNKTHRLELHHNTFVNTEILDLSKDKLNDIDYIIGSLIGSSLFTKL